MVYSAVGVAQALSMGVLHLTQRTLLEIMHGVQDVGGELSSAAVLAARGSIKAAEDIGGDLVQVGKGISRGVSGPERQFRRRDRQAGGRPVKPERGARKAKVGARSTRKRSAARRPAAPTDRAVPDARTPAELNDSRKEQNSRLTEAAQL
jgi:hypothetical protein